MIDAHNHLGQYEDFERQIAELPASIIVLAVTATPSEFRSLEPRLRRHPQVRLAVGLHPAFAAGTGTDELLAFEEAVARTSFVGEIGLDFALPRSTWVQQERVLHRVLACARGKVLSVHSRRAEARTLDLLLEHAVTRAIFHWYNGPFGVLERIVEAGFYCSVGPAMLRSAKGREILARLPRDRVLVETDGPYVSVAGRSAMPADVRGVYAAIGENWSSQPSDVTKQLWENFAELCAHRVTPG